MGPCAAGVVTARFGVAVLGGNGGSDAPNQRRVNSLLVPLLHRLPPLLPCLARGFFLYKNSPPEYRRAEANNLFDDSRIKFLETNFLLKESKKIQNQNFSES